MSMMLTDRNGRPTDRLRRYYRNVFGSSEGRIVFYHIMHSLGYFEAASDLKDVERQALRNFASRLVWNLAPNLGDHSGVAYDLSSAIVDVLSAIPMNENEQEEEHD